ncbi:hypothetical protein Tco_1163238, partial [Tanacetum coccineum]
LFENKGKGFAREYIAESIERIAESILEKQSYMLIGRHDVEKLMRRDPSSVFLPTSLAQLNAENYTIDSEADGVEVEISELLMKLRPIKQEDHDCIFTEFVPPTRSDVLQPCDVAENNKMQASYNDIGCGI